MRALERSPHPPEQAKCFCRRRRRDASCIEEADFLVIRLGKLLQPHPAPGLGAALHADFGIFTMVVITKPAHGPNLLPFRRRSHASAGGGLFQDAAERKFDLVLFWSLDRFSRGVLETLQHLQRLTANGVDW